MSIIDYIKTYEKRGNKNKIITELYSKEGELIKTKSSRSRVCKTCGKPSIYKKSMCIDCATEQKGGKYNE